MKLESGKARWSFGKFFTQDGLTASFHASVSLVHMLACILGHYHKHEQDNEHNNQQADKAAAQSIAVVAQHPIHAL